MAIFKHLKCYLVVLISISTNNLCNHQGYAQPVNGVLLSRPSPRFNDYPSTNPIKLFSRTLLFLQIDQNGKVTGTTNCSSQYAYLEMKRVAKGLVRIKGIKSGRYLAMNSRGMVYTSLTANEDTIFKHIINNVAFESFASYKYYQKTFFDTFIGIRKNGKTKKGRKTRLSLKTVQFLTIHSRTRC